MLKDLIVLVADTNMEFTIRGILTRHQSLRIRNVEFEILTHPERDPGCYLRGHELLRLYVGKHYHALLLFDRVGCGREQKDRDELEQEVEDHLRRSGWEDRAAAIVLDPELETWLWSDSPHVADVLGWSKGLDDLMIWLRQKDFWDERGFKPQRPKEAVEAVLRATDTPRSSSLYRQLAQKVSLNRCDDPAFLKLKSTLQEWFGIRERQSP